MNYREILKKIIPLTQNNQLLWNEDYVYWKCHCNGVSILVDPNCLIGESRSSSGVKLLWNEVSINGAPLKIGWWKMFWLRRAIKKQETRAEETLSGLVQR